MFKPSDEFIKRLIRYYKTHVDADCLPIWTGAYASLREYLVNENITAIRQKLDTLYIDDLWGIDYNQINSWKLPPYDLCFDECLSVISRELNIAHTSREDIIQQLEIITNTSLYIDEYPHRPTIQVKDRKIPLRYLVSYYMAHCLSQHFKEIPTDILEIGAGAGYFAYHFTRNNSTKYHIIDLPVISIIQSYIYATMVGEDRVWFHSEPKSDTSYLHIYSPESIVDLTTKIDCLINHNSFPEIPRHVQSKYLQKVKELLKPSGFFYSVNWEPYNSDQTPIKISCMDTGFTTLSRRLFPLENKVHTSETPDFFEEVYILTL